MSAASAEPAPAWRPDNPRVHPVRILAAWAISALALLLAACIVPGAEIRGVGGAIVVAALVAVVNAIIPPILAALRLPFTIGIGFIAVLAADAAALLIAADVAPQHLYVDGFASALGVSIVASAVSTVAGRDRRASTTTRATRTGSRAASRGAPARRSRRTRRGSSSSRSTASPSRCCAARSATARRR